MSRNKMLITKGQQNLRCGYTTGTCAAAAAKAAAAMFFDQTESIKTVTVTLPSGDKADLEISEIVRNADRVACSVIKDGGDDPDITHGMSVWASVSETDTGIIIDGGEGVGRVTKPGLDQPVGNAAINSVPRQMIRTAVEEEMKKAGSKKGLLVTISIPGGEKTAMQTLNPALGIVGGLSVLGTTGIVEPMSEKALVDTIAVEMRMRKAAGEEKLILAPGNYGLDYLKASEGIDPERAVKISNFIGDSMDLAVMNGFKEILLVGHIGKLIKVAGGIMNTHSHEADARMEILTAYAAVAGADAGTLVNLMNCVTTDAGLDLLKEAGVLETTMDLITERIHHHLKRRTGGKIRIGIRMFSNVHGLLGKFEEE